MLFFQPFVHGGIYIGFSITFLESNSFFQFFVHEAILQYILVLVSRPWNQVPICQPLVHGGRIFSLQCNVYVGLRLSLLELSVFVSTLRRVLKHLYWL